MIAAFNVELSYRLLEHATDLFVEVKANTLKEAFDLAARAVIETTLEPKTVQQKETREFTAVGKDLRYLLFSWFEEIILILITEGFAIGKIDFDIEKNEKYRINAIAHGEPLDFKKHNFKVEIKAPTFHEMEIIKNNQIYMKFLLDL